MPSSTTIPETSTELLTLAQAAKLCGRGGDRQELSPLALLRCRKSRQLVQGALGLVCRRYRLIHGGEESPDYPPDFPAGFSCRLFFIAVHARDFQAEQQSVCKEGSKKSKNPRKMRGFLGVNGKQTWKQTYRFPVCFPAPMPPV